MPDPELTYLMDPEQLKRLFDLICPGWNYAAIDMHSDTACTTILANDDGDCVVCRWSFGLSGRWSMIPSYSL